MLPLFSGSGSGEGSNVALNMGAQMSGLGENPCPCCELTLMQRLTVRARQAGFRWQALADPASSSCAAL